MSPMFMCDQSKQMQRVGMIWGFLQHFSIEGLRAVLPSRLVISIGRLKIAKNLGFSTRILSIVCGCHPWKEVPSLVTPVLPRSPET